jgi:uncharacterized protein involved in outer membrane biogenesis
MNLGSKVMVGILLATIVVLGIVLLNLDRIVKTQVERDLATSLQTTASISTLRFNPLRGRVMMQGVTIANPTGFSAPNLLTIQQMQVQVKLASLLTKTLTIPQLAIQTIEVTFEQQQLRNNLVVAMSKLEDTQTQLSRGDRRFQIDTVTIQNTTATISVSLLGQKPAQLTIELPDFTLQNVTSDNVNGMVLSEVIRALFIRIFNAILQEGANNLPNLTNLLPLRENLPDFWKQFPLP